MVRNAWGASAVDALSTALVMGQKDIVNQIIEYIPTINYFNTSTDVSLFETTIRYLGGMLSGYDFLSGPLADLADNVRLFLFEPTKPRGEKYNDLEANKIRMFRKRMWMLY